MTIDQAQLLKEQAEAVGMSVEIITVDQSTQIDSAISGDFEAIGWRNHPAATRPAVQLVEVGLPVNFGRSNDSEIDRLLDQGRTSLDNREQVYEDLKTRRRGGHNVWLWYTPWTIAMAPDVHGVPARAPPRPGRPGCGTR